MYKLIGVRFLLLLAVTNFMPAPHYHLSIDFLIANVCLVYFLFTEIVGIGHVKFHS